MKTKQTLVQVSCRVPEDVAAALDAEAEKNSRSRSGQLYAYIKMCLFDRQEKSKAEMQDG